MLIRSLAALAVLSLAPPALAQAHPDAEAVRGQVAAFVQPTHEARTEAAMALVRAAGFEPTIETFPGRAVRGQPAREGRNVVFVVRGTAPEGALNEILLTAHYDAVVLRDGSLADGVVDNAASVVAVVRAAQMIRAAHLVHDVRVILFDQEELGLLGAQAWIEAHGVERVAAVINSDVSAYGDAMMYGLNNGEHSAGITNAVETVCAERQILCVGYPNYPPSDDRAFVAAGAPTVSIGFQDAVGAHQMWLAFNAPQGESGLAEGFVPEVFRTIHSDLDTMDKVDPETVIVASEVFAAIANLFDDGAANP